MQTPPGRQEKGTVLETPAEYSELDFKTHVLVLSINALNDALVTGVDLN